MAGIAKQQIQKLAYYPTTIKVNPINTESQNSSLNWKPNYKDFLQWAIFK